MSTSTWSGEAWTDTQSTTAGAVFRDGFESGNMTHTENGIRWTGSQVGQSYPGVAEVNAQQAQAGTYSLMLQYAASVDGSDCSYYFALDRYYTAITIEWDEFVPTNLDASRTGNGQKLLRLWGTDYDERMKIGLNIHGESETAMTGYAAKNEGGGLGSDWGRPWSFCTSGDVGTWIHCGVAVLAPTSSSLGRVKVSRNGSVVSDATYNNYASGEPVGYKNGYIGGHSTGGYAAETRWHVDNFAIIDGFE